MIKEILIALVAVVVVILIIAFAALRFLRADDSDAFDDLPDEPRKPGRAVDDSQPIPAPVQRQRSTRPEPAREQQPRSLARAADRTSDERAAPGYRDREQRPASSGRRGQGTGQRVPVAASRSARPARQADPDSQATASWEAMSDVDYWTELAADKPFTAAPTTTGPAPGVRRGPDAKPDRMPSDTRPAARGEQSALPVRQRTQSRAQEPAAHGLAALARLSGQSARNGQPPPNGQPPSNGQPPPNGQPAERRRPARRPAAPRTPQGPPPISYPGAQGRLPVPLDDDPLTSPSFPAINTADSRSYRTRRPRSRHPSSPDAGPDNSPAGYSPPAQMSPPAQINPAAQSSQQAAQRFPTPEYRAPSMPDRSASAPSGYPVQSPAAAPAANPYGSFVGTAQGGYTNPATGHLDGPGYGSGYAGTGQPAPPDTGWYPAANGNGNEPSYYDASYPGTGHGGTGHSSSSPDGAGAGEAGYASNGYPGPDYYASSYGDSAYPGGYPAAAVPGTGYVGGAFQGQPEPAPYQPPGPYEQRAIGAPELAYGHDGYQGYPGYGGNGG